MPEKIAPKLLSWASQLEPQAREQAIRTSQMPFIPVHMALMADAHLGKGATIGSVIPTRGAIIPAAVGVDIGCGMTAVKTGYTASDLPDDLAPLLTSIGENIPAGVGKGHEEPLTKLDVDGTSLSLDEWERARKQLGTLGSGNHFIEISLDVDENVWAVLHSGSRGVGNRLARRHIDVAKGLMERYFIQLDDPDLAYLVEATAEFDAYITDLLWAQDYAKRNRTLMMTEVLCLLARTVGRDGGPEQLRVDCHHNYTQLEHHFGHNVWVTRKGAIRARAGDLGIIPGSMGTSSYIVRGLGNVASLNSAPHGAGRSMGRKAARRKYQASDLTAAMEGKTWLADDADALLDEIPASYKDINLVMADSADLVDVVAELTQILNFKGA